MNLTAEHIALNSTFLVLQVAISDIFSPTMPSWAILKVLKLEGMGMQSLPASVAEALKALTDLSLPQNNFAEMPPAICLIPTLQTLDLRYNDYLGLKGRDVDTLVHSLPSFRRLDLSKPYKRDPERVGNPPRRGGRVVVTMAVREKDEEKWSRSVGILRAINKLKPKIDLPDFYKPESLRWNSGPT